MLENTKLLILKNNEIEKIIICFMDNFDTIKIVRILNKQKIKCLFHIILDLRLVVRVFEMH